MNQYHEKMRMYFLDSCKVDDYFKIVNSYYSKQSRIKKRIMQMQEPFFLTLTINDNFNQFSQHWKRRLKDFLNNFPSYVANFDKGLHGTERLHFHAVVYNSCACIVRKGRFYKFSIDWQ